MECDSCTAWLPKVIRAYQKLIYAPAEEQELLVQQYRAADQTGDNTESGCQGQSAIASNEHTFDDFDPSLIPETTTFYPVQGAEIDSIQILNNNGHVVNVLQPGGSYQFVVSGRFLTNFAGVFFGIHIKSISGVEIIGQRYPEEGKFVEQVDAGKSFRINFSFRIDILPGVYFVGGGIWSSQEPNCAHRVLDVIMFRVVPTKKQKSFGYIDSSIDEPSWKSCRSRLTGNHLLALGDSHLEILLPTIRDGVNLVMLLTKEMKSVSVSSSVKS